MWIPTAISADQPMYRAIAGALERDVSEGRLAAGERLPTHRALARELGVNVMTITRAYAEASRRGLVSGEVGRGTFVRGGAPRPLVPLPAEESEGALVDLGFNLPAGNPELLDAERALGEVVAPRAAELMLSRGGIHGQRAHRAAGADWIRRSGLQADIDRTVVTGGAQHAMTIALGSICAPGDVVLTEELTYPGIRTLATVLHLRLEGVAIDADGIVPDALAAACRKFGPKVLYCTPTVQNPTGSSMSAKRREELADVVRARGLTVLEDDSNAFSASSGPDGGRPAPPLASYVPEASYYVTGLGKSVASGLRIGYLLAPALTGPTGIAVERMASNLSRLASVAGMTWTAAPLLAELAAHWIRSGAADAVVAWKRAEIARRRELFARIFPVPVWADPGSPMVWLELAGRWTSDELCHEARRHGVALGTSAAFRTGPGAPDGVRLCLATPTERTQLERALRILAGIVACSPGSRGLDRVPRVLRYAGPFG
jgi:DNA-binding transcriptional MocR family regulator